MQLLSGGLYKPTIHRVVQPPADQAHLERVGVFYFAMAADDVRLSSVISEGRDSRGQVVEAQGPLMSEWRKERTRKYGKTALKQSADGKNVEEDEVLGVVVKEYN
jgi:isopenicillin N synthase-like dioxygenase